MLRLIYTALLTTLFISNSSAFAASDKGNWAVPAPFEIMNLEVASDQILRFTTKAEFDPQHFVIEQYVNNIWITVEEIPGRGEMGTAAYETPIEKHLHSGINKFRVRYQGVNNVQRYTRVVAFESTIEKVSGFKRGKQVILSKRTNFLVYDDMGIFIFRGYGSVINLKDLPKKKNIFICFDNQHLEIK